MKRNNCSLERMFRFPKAGTGIEPKSTRLIDLPAAWMPIDLIALSNAIEGWKPMENGGQTEKEGRRSGFGVKRINVDIRTLSRFLFNGDDQMSILPFLAILADVAS